MLLMGIASLHPSHALSGRLRLKLCREVSKGLWYKIDKNHCRHVQAKYLFSTFFQKKTAVILMHKSVAFTTNFEKGRDRFGHILVEIDNFNHMGSKILAKHIEKSIRVVCLLIKPSVILAANCFIFDKRRNHGVASRNFGTKENNLRCNPNFEVACCAQQHGLSKIFVNHLHRILRGGSVRLVVRRPLISRTIRICPTRPGAQPTCLLLA